MSFGGSGFTSRYVQLAASIVAFTSADALLLLPPANANTAPTTTAMRTAPPTAYTQRGTPEKNDEPDFEPLPSRRFGA